MELAATVMDLKSDPTSSWKAVRRLEKGLKHHHTPNRSVCMTKQNGEKAKTDKGNAEDFGKHFSKAFNNPDPLPCNDTVLPLVPTCKEFTKLGTPHLMMRSVPPL
eukprot:12730166-Ditylum_brightwellii.AAC.1